MAFDGSAFTPVGPKGQTDREREPGLRSLSGSGLVNFQSPWDLQKIFKALQPLSESHLLRDKTTKRAPQSLEG